MLKRLFLQMALLWLIGILVSSIVIFFTYLHNFSQSAKLVAKIPGPKLVFLAGNVLDMGSSPIGNYFFNLIL